MLTYIMCAAGSGAAHELVLVSTEALSGCAVSAHVSDAQRACTLAVAR